MEFKLNKILGFVVVLAALFLIIYLAVYVRLSTLDAPTVLDYDPWWYYRHALEIMKNNYLPLPWDLQSYYPPGRPYEFQIKKQLNTIICVIFLFFPQFTSQKLLEFLSLKRWLVPNQ